MEVKKEDIMAPDKRERLKTIIDREKLNLYNAEGCPACGKKFTLGDPVVLACGAWEGEPKYIHEDEAIYDKATATYFERRCYASRKGSEKSL